MSVRLSDYHSCMTPCFYTFAAQQRRKNRFHMRLMYLLTAMAWYSRPSVSMLLARSRQCLLYGVTCFSSSGSINVHTTCTQNLQTFNQCKRLQSSPLKCSTLHRRASQSARSISQGADYDPRSARFATISATRVFFLNNTCISFQASYPFFLILLSVCQNYRYSRQCHLPTDMPL